MMITDAGTLVRTRVAEVSQVGLHLSNSQHGFSSISMRGGNFQRDCPLFGGVVGGWGWRRPGRVRTVVFRCVGSSIHRSIGTSVPRSVGTSICRSFGSSRTRDHGRRHGSCRSLRSQAPPGENTGRRATASDAKNEARASRRATAPLRPRPMEGYRPTHEGFGGRILPLLQVL